MVRILSEKQGWFWVCVTKVLGAIFYGGKSWSRDKFRKLRVRDFKFLAYSCYVMCILFDFCFYYV